MRRVWQRSGMLGVLAVLLLVFALATISEQPIEGEAGGMALAHEAAGQRVLIAGGNSSQDGAFLDALAAGLRQRGSQIVAVVRDPAAARLALEMRPDVIACTPAAFRWTVFDSVRERVRTTSPRRYSVFLTATNLLNVLNQISVIAILAAGMTMVILTRGIDLSVGSLIALAAVVAAWLIERWFGATGASGLGMWAACALAVTLCAAVGALSGTLVAVFSIPPFIATLAMMLIASGAAFLISRGESIYNLPDSFVWLGRETMLGLPNAVLLTLFLYGMVHVTLTRTMLGRHIMAVGNNPEAARFSGISLPKVRLAVYTACGALAGLGGIVTASQLKSGAPTYGGMYELYAIAAVVVGGTSLSGGRGSVLGTLVGALIIAVIQNGMNLTGVENYTQKIVLGLVILGAVLLDRLSQRQLRTTSHAE
ncbi:MAG: ABC transporter permease [Verrucomicrobiales bacterium]